MKREQIWALARNKIQHFEQEEQSLFRINTRFYNGRFDADSTTPYASADRSDRSGGRGIPKGALNLFFPTVEAGITALLGRDQALTAEGFTPEAEKAQFAVTQLLDKEFKRNRIHSTSQVALLDALLCRRGIYKTVPDVANKGARILCVRPELLGYDPDARTAANSRFWIQCVPMPWRMFAQRVREGTYIHPRTGLEIKPEHKPRWADASMNLSAAQRDVFGYAVVWELYDMHAMKAYHFHESSRTIVWEGDISDHPYAMFSLNHNRENLDGLSEVELIFDQQLTANDMRTTLMQLVYKLIPRMLYDLDLIDGDALKDILHSPAASFHGVKTKGRQLQGGKQRSLRDAFSELPMSQIPADYMTAMQLGQADAQFVSGIASQRRGTSSNVRTAREMAYIQQSDDGRIAHRRANMEHDGLVPVGHRTLKFLKRYRTGNQHLKVGNKWTELSQDALLGFEGSIGLSQYTPIRSNPGMVAEALGQVSNLIVGSKIINEREVFAMLFEGFGISRERGLLSEEEVQAIAEKEAQMAAGPPTAQDADQMAAAQDAALDAPPEDGQVGINDLQGA